MDLKKIELDSVKDILESFNDVCTLSTENAINKMLDGGYAVNMLEHEMYIKSLIITTDLLDLLCKEIMDDVKKDEVLDLISSIRDKILIRAYDSYLLKIEAYIDAFERSDEIIDLLVPYYEPEIIHEEKVKIDDNKDEIIKRLKTLIEDIELKGVKYFE